MLCFHAAQTAKHFLRTQNVARAGKRGSARGQTGNICVGNNRAVYTRENKPRLTLAAAYIIRERNYLYECNL